LIETYNRKKGASSKNETQKKGLKATLIDLWKERSDRAQIRSGLTGVEAASWQAQGKRRRSWLERSDYGDTKGTDFKELRKVVFSDKTSLYRKG